MYMYVCGVTLEAATSSLLIFSMVSFTDYRSLNFLSQMGLELSGAHLCSFQETFLIQLLIEFKDSAHMCIT